MNCVRVLILGCCALLTGCDWVDSSSRSNAPPESAVLLDDASGNGAIVMQELSDKALRAASFDRDGVVQAWRWSESPIAAGDLEVCHDIDGFDSSVAAESFESACTEPASCAMNFTQAEGETTAEVMFNVRSPQLRAPVGATYELTAVDNDGGTASTTHTFCLIAINEAPDAADDAFTVLEGTMLVVGPNERNLLSNDLDDIDVTNSPELKVLPDVISAPVSASVFELREDGGFSYAFAGANLTSNLVDRFTYAVTDGRHTVNAEVTLTIVAEDDPPVQLSEVPTLVATAGISFAADLTSYFRDPESSGLGFRVLRGEFPENYVLGSTGILEGVGALADVGNHEVTIGVSDGTSELEATIALQVVDNEPVSTSSIPVQAAVVGERVRFFLSPYFADPESQALQFELNIDASNQQILVLTVDNQTGVVEGFVRQPGRHELGVSASDGINNPTVATVVIEAQNPNRPPVFVAGSVADQQVQFGQVLQTIRPEFNDPDSDAMVYAINLPLPRGVLIDAATGIISGRPRERGNWVNLQVIATDSVGNSARSDRFGISIR